MGTHCPGHGRDGGSGRTIGMFVNRVRPLKLTVDICPASKSPLDSSGNIIAQFLCLVQRSPDPDNLHLAGRYLSGRFVVISRSHQTKTALVAGQHAPKDRRGALLRLSLRTNRGRSIPLGNALRWARRTGGCPCPAGCSSRRSQTIPQRSGSSNLPRRNIRCRDCGPSCGDSEVAGIGEPSRAGKTASRRTTGADKSTNWAQ
jgi:hypothetical protein